MLVRSKKNVSILAHPGGWALLRTSVGPAAVLMFQSSPTPEGGRYLIPQHPHNFRHRFQSSPTPEGGRYAEKSRGA
uniref:Uncharacterized protein n=1 Tax=mine drainage metagenome TaxID=410659 RepID=E6QQG1_9ZZZZ